MLKTRSRAHTGANASRIDVTPTLPPGTLLYAIGDIHGRADLLEELLRRIEEDARESPAERKILVFLGDYIDRGPNSRTVVDMLLARAPKNFACRFLKGNHEALMLDFLDDPDLLEFWLVNGGGATLASYGLDMEELARFGASAETWRNNFAAVLPEAHLSFFHGLELSVSLGDYFFVHAGVRPDLALDEQTEADLVWIRAPFLDWARPFGKIVVHGHTPGREPVTRPNRIGIDTGAWFSDRLTALRLEGDRQGFLQT
jgi:serine/threonine protein phosphatase 1